MKKYFSLLALILNLLSCGDGHAQEHLSSEIITEDSICRLAWEQNEELLDPEDRMGNPFPMLTQPHQKWHFEVNWQGRTLTVVPALKFSFQIELSPEQTTSGQRQVIPCEVPVSWKALDSQLVVTYDPIFHNSENITMINGKAFGSETKGGIYLRHNLISSDRTDVNLSWHLNPAPITTADAINAVKRQLHVPREQAVTLIKAADYLQRRGHNSIEAIAMTVNQEPIRHWAVIPSQASTLWPTLRFLPSGTPSSAATIEEAWSAAKILDLAVFKLWDVEQKKISDCSNTAGTPSQVLCRQIVDDTFTRILGEAQTKGKETCVHLAWKAEEFSPFFVSTFCVNNQGFVRSEGSKAMARAEFLAANPTARER